MIKINHDTIEIDYQVVADFRPGYLADNAQGILHSALETETLFEDGDLIFKTEYDELETRLSNALENAYKTKCALEDLRRDLSGILETCGVKINKKFDDFFRNLTHATDEIET